MTDFCLEIAKDWGVKQVTGITTPGNNRVIRIARKRGFQITYDPESESLVINLEL